MHHHNRVTHVPRHHPSSHRTRTLCRVRALTPPSPRRTVAVSLWFTALRAVSVLASVSVSVDMSGKVEEDAGAGETAVMPTLFLSHGGGTCAWC